MNKIGKLLTRYTRRKVQVNKLRVEEKDIVINSTSLQMTDQYFHEQYLQANLKTQKK